MKQRMLLGLLLLVAPLAALNTTTNITLVHIADGDQWTTTFTIVNLDTVQASYTLYFYDDNGSPLNLSIEGPTGAAPPAPSVSGVLAINGSAVIQTARGSVLHQGWARLNSTQILGAQAVYVEHAAIADYQAAVPIGEVSTSFTIAFDNRNGYFTGVAIASTDQLNPATVTATFRDENGGLMGGGPIPIAVLPRFGHTALLLNDPSKFSFAADQTGTVEFDCGSCSIAGLGLRFAPYIGTNPGPFATSTAFTR
jgi:hypothetical protein